MFFSPPVPETCEPCLMKLQPLSRITGNRERKGSAAMGVVTANVNHGQFKCLLDQLFALHRHFDILIAEHLSKSAVYLSTPFPQRSASRYHGLPRHVPTCTRNPTALSVRWPCPDSTQSLHSRTSKLIFNHALPLFKQVTTAILIKCLFFFFFLWLMSSTNLQFGKTFMIQRIAVCCTLKVSEPCIISPVGGMSYFERLHLSSSWGFRINSK